MYEKLAKILQVCGDSNNSCENCPVRENDGSCPHGEWEFAAEKFMLQAADAIEAMNYELKSLYKLLGTHPDPRGENGEAGVVMAHWKKNPVYYGDDTSGFVDPNWCCSNCGSQAPIDPYWGIYDLVDICPHCGKKMEYEEEE